jgi:hypothetical protein
VGVVVCVAVGVGASAVRVPSLLAAVWVAVASISSSVGPQAEHNTTTIITIRIKIALNRIILQPFIAPIPLWQTGHAL